MNLGGELLAQVPRPEAFEKSESLWKVLAKQLEKPDKSVSILAAFM